MSFATTRLRSPREQRKRSTRRSRLARRAHLETLEGRRLLALLGIDAGIPLIISEPGDVSYNATTDRFSATAQAFIFQPTSSAASSRLIGNGTFDLEFEVDETGAVVGGVPGDDFTVTGSIDLDLDNVPEYTGTLITGEVVAFGFQDNSPTSSTDSYDLRLSVTGGSLVADFFLGKDIGLEIGSENGTFNGVFTESFGGNHKSEFGPIDPILPSEDPQVDIEKFTRVDVNPVDIEKLVRVESPGVEGNLCDVLNDPVALTFRYVPSLVLDTQQPVPNKAEIITNNGLDDDGTSFVVVSKGEGASGELFFAGEVDVDELFTVSGDFGSNTYISFFDEAGGSLLQEVRYHTSCSAPINLGDIVLSATLVGFNDGTSDGNIGAPNLGPGIGDDDADEPTGPSAIAGDTVVFTFVVTNPIPETTLSNVMVTDQLLAPDEEPLPDPIPVEALGFNVGDTNTDGLLDFGEEWLYTSTVAVTSTTEPGLYVDKATVVAKTESGGDVMDMDPAHFTVPLQPTVEGNVCDVLGDPVSFVFEYAPSLELNTDQPVPNKAEIIVNNGLDDDNSAFVVVSKGEGASGEVFFSGSIEVGQQFTVAGSFGSNTYISFFDEEGGALLQEARYHTSCSAPINLGDEVLSATLVGYNGEDGSAELPPPPDPPADVDFGGVVLATDHPFDPDSIGDDADAPTGPLAAPGSRVTWTYQVSNTGNVPLTISSVFDDNETSSDPPGAGDDDFEPAPVLKENGFNFGDDNDDDLLDPGEVWYFQAMEIATEAGQHKNTAKVVAESPSDEMVMDDDMSHYLVNPLDIEKLVRVESPGSEGNICDILDDPVALTFQYVPSLLLDTDQPTPNKAEIIVNQGIDDDGTSFVVVSKDEDATGELFFSGVVSFDETFVASGDFASNTYISFFDEQGGELLQQVRYHTSCSAPITLGDTALSARLVAYDDGTPGGTIGAPNLGPGIADDDADLPSGPSAIPGDTAVFTYVVTNNGETSLAGAIANVVVTDQQLAPSVGSIFNPDPVLDDDGFNVGDTNLNNLLDIDEVWLYTSLVEVVEDTPVGVYTNIATVVGNPIVEDVVYDQELVDMDAANFEVLEVPPFVGDVCDAFGDPAAMIFQYVPGSSVDSGQGDDANIRTDNGVDDDGTSYVIVTDKKNADDALDGEGKRHFEGLVDFNETFTASGEIDSFGSKIYIHFFDDVNGGLLQSIEYHTSCSQPIQLGDVIGNASLVGYIGEDGSAGQVPVAKFFVVDKDENATFNYGDAGTPLGSNELENDNGDARGVTSSASGDQRWVIDKDKHVYKYDASGALTGSWKAANVSDKVAGIATDGSNIWIVEEDRDVFYFAGGASFQNGTFDENVTFELGGSDIDKPSGLTTDGSHLWIVDEGEDAVFKYTVNGNFVSRWDLDNDNSKAKGITLNPADPTDETLWVVDQDKDKVFAYGNGKSGTGVSLLGTFPLASKNDKPEGIADPDPALLSRFPTFVDPHDVNKDGLISALDALLVINRIQDGNEFDIDFDVSGDLAVTSLDALRVINFVASRSGSDGGLAVAEHVDEVFSLGDDDSEFMRDVESGRLF